MEERELQSERKGEKERETVREKERNREKGRDLFSELQSIALFVISVRFLRHI